MANSWFRMYAEFRNDPKVRTMSDTMQIRLVRLFCLRCDGFTEKLSRDELMYAIGCNDPETFHETEVLFLSKGFIDENWSLLNWNKRQFISDSSTDRVRKFRANHAPKQNETLHETRETQNETDQNRTEQNRTEKKQQAASAPEIPAFVDGDAWQGFVEMRKKIPRVPFTDRARKGILADLGRLRDWGIDPNERLRKATNQGWRGVLFDNDGPQKKDPYAGMIFANTGAKPQ